MNAIAVGAATAMAVLVLTVPVRQRITRVRVASRSDGARQRSRTKRGLPIAVGGLLVVALGGPTALLLTASALVVGRWWLLRRRRLARVRSTRTSYPDAIDLVVLALRAGALPTTALAATAPHLPAELRAAFDEVAARTERGERFADAIGALPERLGEIARPMADALAAAERYGLPIAPVLERLADEARAQRRRAADAAARQLPVRLAGPLVVCTLPSFVLLAIVPLLVGALSSWRLP
jgi:tight adherence protein C